MRACAGCPCMHNMPCGDVSLQCLCIRSARIMCAWAGGILLTAARFINLKQGRSSPASVQLSHRHGVDQCWPRDPQTV